MTCGVTTRVRVLSSRNFILTHEFSQTMVPSFTQKMGMKHHEAKTTYRSRESEMELKLGYKHRMENETCKERDMSVG